MAERTQQPQFPPSPRKVVIWVPPGGQLLAVIGVIEAFDTANRVSIAGGRAPLYALQVIGLRAQTATAAGPILATGSADDVDELHTLVVGGAVELGEHPSSPQVLETVGALADRAERVVGVCMGAFVLGELGLLDGRRCTSHWLGLDALGRRFPQATVELDALYAEDGRIFTSAGATAAIDLALHLIRSDAGAGLALAVARALVVFAHRPGGQSQFGTAVRLRSGVEDRIQHVVDAIINDPAGDHRVDRLAAKAGQSPRHFARTFREQCGETPGAFVARARVEASQRALCHSDAGMQTIATACGFGSVDTFQRTFRRVMGVSPSAYRARFKG